MSDEVSVVIAPRTVITNGGQVFEKKDPQSNRIGFRFKKIAVKMEDILEQRVAKRPSGRKTAVLADKTIDCGLSRMISMLADGLVPYRIELFKDIESAYLWLDQT